MLSNGVRQVPYDSYAVDEALDEEFATGHGELSVHEVKTDPRRNVNLAYLSYYDAGARVVEFSNRRGLVEKGFFIDEGGSHFWGTFPHYVGEREGAPLLLFSDRDFGPTSCVTTTIGVATAMTMTTMTMTTIGEGVGATTTTTDLDT